MKKLLFTLAFALIAANVSAADDADGKKGFGGKGGRHDMAEMFENGCLKADSLKGPMAGKEAEMDTDGDSCITEEEFHAHMKASRPEGMGEKGEGKGPKGGHGKNRPTEASEE